MRRAADCTATAIATSDPKTRPRTASVGATYDWLERHDFDSAPVVDKGAPIGYVTVDELGSHPDDAILDAACEPLEASILIAPDTPFDRVVEALYERPFYYLADRNGVTGVLTRADLNTEPVYQHLYTLLSRVERGMRDLVLDHEVDWRASPRLQPDTLETIDERHGRAEAADVALDPLHYAQFSTLTTIVTAAEPCWRALGFDSDHRARSRLDDLRDLRNDIAHATPIIQNTERGISERGRTVTDLAEQYELLGRLLQEMSA